MLRWLVLVLLLPSVAAQAPTLSATVSTGEFTLEASAGFDVIGTFECQAFDLDPDVVYTLSFVARHYTSGGANASGIDILVPANVTFQAPCFPAEAVPATHRWLASFQVLDRNATPGAMYHMDVAIASSVVGRLGQEAPSATGVHTMGSAPLGPVGAVPGVEEKQSSAPPIVWLLLAIIVLARRR